jgi:hypothetical protein
VASANHLCSLRCARVLQLVQNAPYQLPVARSESTESNELDILATVAIALAGESSYDSVETTRTVLEYQNRSPQTPRKERSRKDMLDSNAKDVVRRKLTFD